jgi:acyl dehydratase
MAISQKFVDKEYAPITYQVGYEKLKEFLIATKADREKFSEIVPLTFPVVYQHVLLSEVLFDPDLNLNLKKLVHGEQEFRYFKPVRVGDTITSKGKIAKIFQKGPHDFVVLHTESENQLQEKVSESNWTFVIRGGNDTEFTMKEKILMKLASILPQNPKEKQAKENAYRLLVKACEHDIDLEKPFQDLFFFEKFKNEESILRVFVDEYMPQVYAGASGDYNTIHLDRDFGKSVGLGSNILHGMATMALGASLASQDINPRDFKLFKARFAGVVKPRDVLTYRGKWQETIFQFSAKNQLGQEVLNSAVLEVY